MRLPVGSLLAALLLAALFAGVPATAQAPERQSAFVYGINAAVPGNFVGTFAPPAARSIYLLAGETSIISPRITEIYYWPVTNEYRANWTSQNELVPGTLEVLRNGRVVEDVESTEYTIHFVPKGESATAQSYFGAEARAAEARFRARQQSFQEASHRYNAELRAWQDAVDAAREKGDPENIPPEPTLPEAIGVFSNGLNRGFPLDLPPGAYKIRVRGTDGKTIPESERTVTVFNARRSAVGYTVVPETRWTTPEEVNDPSDVIVGRAGSNLYLEPRITREYPARAWDLLQNPQQPVGTAGDWKWVTGESVREGTLETAAGDRVVARQSLTSYRVKQIPGAALGYEVLRFDPKANGAPSSPDFEAFPLRLGDRRSVYKIRMVSPEGAVMEGSERLVHVPAGVSILQLLLLPAAPLAIGASLMFRRRTTTLRTTRE